jgi:carboxymethylenebutenolidase
MPFYDVNHIEYGITSGHIHIALESGAQLPAYWAHPYTGRRFPAVALVHDWWGLTPITRRLANHYAQAGYYVIVPDLFDGKVAATPEQAMTLVQQLGADGFSRVQAALQVLEEHHNTNRDVAVVGIGMGGSLAYEAAIHQPSLEATVSYYGFPQRYWKSLSDAQAPILAIYGDHDEHISLETVTRLQTLLDKPHSDVEHQVVVVPGVGHDFLRDAASPAEQMQGRAAFNRTLQFLETYLRGPLRAPQKNY